MARKPKAPTYTIEFGNGETYRNSRPTVYKHDRYPSGSVLSGRERRTWVDDFDSVAEAKAAFPAAEDLTGANGSTHIPVDVLTAGLPDGPDY